MTDFFSRLAERALCIAPTIQPMIVPLYAPEVLTGEDSLLDSDAEQMEQKEQNSLSTTIATLKTQYAQVSVSHSDLLDTQATPLSELQHSLLRAAHGSIVPPKQDAQTPVLTDAPPSVKRESSSPPPPYPELARMVQQTRAKIEEHPTDVEHTQITNTYNYKEYTTSLRTSQNPPQHKATTKDVRRQRNSSTHDSQHALATTESLPHQHVSYERLEHENVSDLNDIPLPARRDALIPGTHITHLARAFIQPPDRMMKEAAAPTIQVTIGRIEVRAIPTPVPSTSAQRQQVAPPVMSLDDYLSQRAKGGH
jgi:hypothetical protein